MGEETRYGILVGVDGSRESAAAVRWAAREAQLFGVHADVCGDPGIGELAGRPAAGNLSLIHISEPTRRLRGSRMPSSA